MSLALKVKSVIPGYKCDPCWQITGEVSPVELETKAKRRFAKIAQSRRRLLREGLPPVESTY